jgi:cytochrome b involved in lipid metabolism
MRLDLHRAEAVRLRRVGYLHSHPGGAQILHDYAGRDVTNEFRDTHSDWARTLQNHGDLRVGRMVDEISQISHMEEDEVVLLDRVFTFSSQYLPSALTLTYP